MNRSSFRGPSTSQMIARVACAAALSLGGCGSEGDEAPSPDVIDATDARAVAPPVITESPDDAAERGIQLTSITPAPGVDMRLTSGDMPIDTPTGNHPDAIILEVKGAGLALIDYDNDGDSDVFVPNGATLADTEAGPGSRLYRNDGDMTFVDVTEDVGLSHRRWSMGVAVADYDGDGLDDMYVSCYGANALLRNLGGGRFEDVATHAGVADAGWSACSTWGDLDNDGDLDLYVVNYVELDLNELPKTIMFKGAEVFGGPLGLKGQADVVYENLGDGTFRDRTTDSGCGVVTPSFGLNAIITDYDHDGWQDIMVGNDSMPNFLFQNRGGDGALWSFEDRGARSGFATNMNGSPQATMGMALGDLDGNGFADLVSTNFANDTNTLHMNQGGTWFDDQTRRYGLALVSRPFLGWSCAFVDFDHDMDEDLLIVNGHVFPQASVAIMGTEYAQESLLFERDGARFERVMESDAMPWLAERHCDRTAVFGDLDGDGDVDVLVAELNGSIRLLENSAAASDRSDWVTVALRDARPGMKNGHGYGARLELTTDGVVQRRWVVSGGGFMCTSSPAAHFGLGSHREEAGELTVIWSDGTEQRIGAIAAGAHHVIERQ